MFCKGAAAGTLGDKRPNFLCCAKRDPRSKSALNRIHRAQALVRRVTAEASDCRAFCCKRSPRATSTRIPLRGRMAWPAIQGVIAEAAFRLVAHRQTGRRSLAGARQKGRPRRVPACHLPFRVRQGRAPPGSCSMSSMPVPTSAAPLRGCLRISGCGLPSDCPCSCTLSFSTFPFCRRPSRPPA